MPARGQGFGALRKRLDALQHLEGLPDVLGVAAVKLVADGFRREKDPYGNPWEGLRYRKGKILRRTGRMFNSTAYAASPRRVTVAITARYSIYHQKGTAPRRRRTASLALARAGLRGGDGSIPARPMVPDDRGLPPAWEQVLQRDTTAFLRRLSGMGA
jgi:phage gpG-like protein